MEGGAANMRDLDNLKATELSLRLPGTGAPKKPTLVAARGSKRTLSEANKECRPRKNSSEDNSQESDGEVVPVAKAQIVGWPPVRSYRKNSLQAMKMKPEMAGIYVKVSMDGAPYLRKIDLKVYNEYRELREALEDMFKCFSPGEVSRMDDCKGCDYAVTYEDKDGDWMLVGDVPWEMFVTSCKRLRIMKGSEARGLGSSQ